MRTRNCLIVLLCCLGIGCLTVLLFCLPYLGKKSAGHGYMLGLYHSDRDEAWQSTTAAFKSWLGASGWKTISSPGGVAEWSGMHSQGDKSSWYAMSIGSNELHLRITTNARGRGIHASTDYNGRFTDAELAAMRQRNHQLWLDIIAWFEANAPENNVINDPQKWYSDARISLQKAYTE